MKNNFLILHCYFINMSNIRKYLALFFILPMAWLFYNNAVFKHYHQTSKGQLVKHAHPFKFANHSCTEPITIHHEHCEDELTLLDITYLSASSDAITLHLHILISVSFNKPLSSPPILFICSLKGLSPQLRAPPLPNNLFS